MTIELIISLILLIGLTFVHRYSPSLRHKIALPLNVLRRMPSLYWLVLLIYVTLGIFLWLGMYHPPLEIVPVSGFVVLGLLVWGFVLLLIFDMDSTRRQDTLARLKTSRLTGVMISLTTIALILLALEIGMRLFMAQSDNFARTLTHQRWVQLYWNPINSLGYRDTEIDPTDDNQQILVLGDSFPSGHGTNRIEDTFPHILGTMLGDDYTVHIAAQPGWNTADEMRALSEYPVAPDVVILSYFINDIEFAATQHGLFPQWPEAISSPVMQWLVDRLYLANFLYWRIFVFQVDDFSTRYSDYILEAYGNPAVWDTQKAELDKIIAWTQNHNARLIVLIWPILTDVEGSSKIIQPVAAYFEERDIAVVNLTDDLRDRPPNSLTVNAFDGHPNIEIHALAAQRLYEEFE